MRAEFRMGVAAVFERNRIPTGLRWPTVDLDIVGDRAQPRWGHAACAALAQLAEQRTRNA
jgi:hypothetical protein